MSSDWLPDIHSQPPDFQVSLSRTGVTGIKKVLVQENEEGGTTVLHASIDAFVELAPGKKGAHLSRHNEVINECVADSVEKNVADVEVLCSGIVKKLLEKTGASRAEARLRAELAVPGSHEGSTLLAKAVSWSEGGALKARKTIGVEVTGMTVCPCGIELSKAFAKEKLSEQGFGELESEEILASLPLASHNQRCKATLLVETWENERVDASDLIEIAQASMSSPLFDVLKREGEQQAIIDAHAHPVFTEDVVRLMLKGILSSYPELQQDALIVARAVSMESIHPHDVFAEKIVSFKELGERGLE